MYSKQEFIFFFEKYFLQNFIKEVILYNKKIEFILI